MLTDILVLNDGVADHSFTRISQTGMNSIRAEASAPSSEGSRLHVKNTINLGAPSSKNRHLIQLNWNHIDSVTGDVTQESAHLVISRCQASDDDDIVAKVNQLLSACSTANLEAILVGGN